YVAPQKRGAARAHAPDVAVTVLDRKRKRALLMRRPHPLELGGGHTPAVHEQLATAADPAVQRVHERPARPRLRQAFAADLALLAPDGPECARIAGHDAGPFYRMVSEAYRDRAKETTTSALAARASGRCHGSNGHRLTIALMQNSPNALRPKRERGASR